VATLAVSITKRVTWRGEPQEFSNVYHYNRATMPTEGSEAQAIINRLMTVERNVHSTDVTFVRGRLWGPTGIGVAASKMIEVVNFASTAGLVTADPTFYREWSFLLTFPLGRYGTKNRPQFLRKWMHTCVPLGISGNDRSGSTTLSVTPTGMITFMGDIRSLVLTGQPETPLNLCNETGRVTIGGGSVYPFLEHRQFGR